MSSEEIDTRTRILDAAWRLLEQQQGQGVKMGDIAKAVGISRQAVYLHFPNRTDLLIATLSHVDEVKGLDKRLAQLEAATNSTEMLRACVEIWGNYIPEIYGMAKAMLQTRDTDEAMAAAWDSAMNCLREVCQQIIEYLASENRLSSEWSVDQATDFFWSQLSITNWETLTKDCGWSQQQYIEKMTSMLLKVLVS
ncbi:MAG: TetR/AcrR family transcriptional regulator [Gammaproteobacteria bacterium]|nr:TetR/AcrR family transcriptional regulator [Gammaproteobacteria bacterium]